MNFELENFFYNLLPGTFFLAFWILENPFFNQKALEFANFIQDKISIGIIFIILSLFLGFILHGFMRGIKWIIVKYCKGKPKKFYDENAVIFGKGLRGLPVFFSDRAAMWGSILIGLFISLFLLKIRWDCWYLYIFAFIIFGFLYAMDLEKEKDSTHRIYKALENKKIKD